MIISCSISRKLGKRAVSNGVVINWMLQNKIYSYLLLFLLKARIRPAVNPAAIIDEPL